VRSGAFLYSNFRGSARTEQRTGGETAVAIWSYAKLPGESYPM